MRTTPKLDVEIAKICPDLAFLERTTVRLHPRPGLVQDKSGSKLGGEFVLPAGEPWPSCEQHQIPLAPVLQLAKNDVPELGFPSEADVFQLFCCLLTHRESRGFSIKVLWRRRGDLGDPRPKFPVIRQALDDILREHLGERILPNECQVHPERVKEYPDWDDLPKEIQQRFDDFAYSEVQEQLEQAWGVADGTKVGGHVKWIQGSEYPICTCSERMEHLLTISSDECGTDHWRRWLPEEDREPGRIWERIKEINEGIGLGIGDAGRLFMFVCRKCETMPIHWIMQCS